MHKVRLLLVSYDFPPVGGGGVQRNLKYIKYLDRLGHKASVLTVKNRQYYVYDYTLLDELPDNVNIYRSNSWDPISLAYKFKSLINSKERTKDENKKGNKVKEEGFVVKLYRFLRDWILLPDGYGGWIPFATKLGLKAIKKEKTNIILGTFPYVSNAFVTYRLFKKTGLPYIIDFRDGWLDDPYFVYPSKLHRKFHAYYENKILQKAAHIITFADIQTDLFKKRYPSFADKVTTITNGYDPEDLENIIPDARIDKTKYRIVYSGAVYIDRRDTFKSFIKAISELSVLEREPLEIIFVGDKSEWATEMVSERGLDNTISFTGYKTHSEALALLSSADAALLFLRKDDFVAYTGKVFEYIGLRLPILACVEPTGECAHLLNSISHGYGVCAPDNPNQMLDKLRYFLEQRPQKLSGEHSKRFSRKEQSKQLATIIEHILK